MSSMSERIRGSYDDALYKSTYRPTLVYCTATTLNRDEVMKVWTEVR